MCVYFEFSKIFRWTVVKAQVNHTKWLICELKYNVCLFWAEYNIHGDSCQGWRDHFSLAHPIPAALLAQFFFASKLFYIRYIRFQRFLFSIPNLLRFCIHSFYTTNPGMMKIKINQLVTSSIMMMVQQQGSHLTFDDIYKFAKYQIILSAPWFCNDLHSDHHPHHHHLMTIQVGGGHHHSSAHHGSNQHTGFSLTAGYNPLIMILIFLPFSS